MVGWFGRDRNRGGQGTGLGVVAVGAVTWLRVPANAMVAVAGGVSRETTGDDGQPATFLALTVILVSVMTTAC